MSDRLRRLLLGPALVIGAVIVGQLVGAVWSDTSPEGLDLWIPWSVQIGLAGVYGALNALVAVGVILVYRSGRVVNFSQAGFGVSAVMLYLLLASAWEWSWYLAVPAALAAATLVGLLVEVFIVRRFATSPRLVLTVVTIALGQALAGITLFLPRVWGFEPLPDDPTGGLAGLPSSAPRTPFDRFSWEWFPVRFSGNHVAAVLVTLAVMVGLAIFFRVSTTGIAVRGSSENSSRAQLLGINTNNLSSVVWAVAALLAAIGALLNAMVAGDSVLSAAGQALTSGGTSGLAEAIGASLLLRALTAAVIAKLDDVPTAVGAAIAISIFEQSVFWSVRQTAAVDLVLLIVIVVALLAQRHTLGRVEESGTSTWAATEEIRGIPHELAPLPQVKVATRRFLWALGLVVLAYPWVMSPSQTNLGALYAIYGIIGISLVVLTGWGGQISLGQFGFVAVGGVVGGAVTSRWGLPFPVALVIGSVAAAVVAMGIGLPALRIKGLFLAVTTLGFAITASTVLLNEDWFGWLLPDRVNRPVFLWFDSRTDERTYYYLCLVALVVVIVLVNGLRTTRTGRLLIAMRDNERGAQAYGLNLVRARLLAFALSGGIAGFAGVLYSHHQSAVSAQGFGPEQSIQVFLMAVLGGLGSVYAVLVGAIYLATTTIVLDNAAGQLLASSFGVLAILVFFPKGLGSLAFQARDGWLRRVALRNRIWVPSLMGDRVKVGEEARVPIAPRLDEQGELERVYALDSAIGEAGASQLTKLWRY
jgi:branched-chain amino acid transport system permease protein